MKVIDRFVCHPLTLLRLPNQLFRSRIVAFSRLLWLFIAAIGFSSPGNVHAQSYGPPAILSNGTLNTYGYTAYDSTRGYSYDAYSGFEIDQYYQVYDANVPDVVIGSYDPSSFTFSVSSLLAATWDGNALRPTPPQYISITYADGTYTCTLNGVNYTSGQGWYNEEFDYSDGAGSTVTMHWNFNGSLSGDISYNCPAGMAGGNFTGNLNLSTIAGAIVGGGTIGFPSNAQPPPRQGPPYISWNGLLLTYSSTDSSGNDSYADSTNTTQVTINNGSGTSGSGPSGTVSGSYNTATQTFSVNVGNFFAMDVNRNPIGLPPGLVIVVGFPGFAQSILLSNNTNSLSKNADYFYQQPDGTWANEYVSLPANYWFVVADNAGNYNSQIYVTVDTSTTSNTINAVSGWPVSNAFPPQVYVNTADCLLQWSTQYEYGSGQAGGGSVDYYSSDQSTFFQLGWSWTNGIVVWTWGTGSSSGAWDGVSTFSGQPAGLRISLTPPTSPVYGPSVLYWNGNSLSYDGNASVAANADVYSGGGIRITVDSAGNVSVFTGNSNVAAYTGTYDAASHLFNFGNANFGTISGWDGSGHVLGTSKSNGNVDISGNVLSLGSWLNPSGESVGGLFLSFTAPSSGSSDAEVRFGSSIALTDWVWSRASVDGSTSHLAAMQLDANNRLLLFPPADDSVPKVILDPVNGSWFNGPLRVMPQGDVSMGIFQSGVQPQP